MMYDTAFRYVVLSYAIGVNRGRCRWDVRKVLFILTLQ